jgi:arabinose-5-phosphate isomerase
VNYSKRARDIIDVEIEGLSATRDELSTGFEKAVNILLTALKARRKVVVTGVGKCLHVAEKLSATLASTGSTSVVLHPSQALHGDLGILSEGDVLLALSYSGSTDELLQLIPSVRRLEVGIVAVTASMDSTLAQCSDAVIAIRVPREACPFNMAPTSSTTAMMAVGDALAVVLLEARGFRREDYAKLHPGGAIGRTLLLRVEDIMRRGDRLAVLPTTATVRDALLAMTAARSGSAGIVDADGKLLAIFTDGDLRRHLSTDPEILQRRIDTVMTTGPVTVNADRLAVDALCLFEEHSIDDLMVVDDQGRLVGAIDLQDLPKLKLM